MSYGILPLEYLPGEMSPMRLPSKEGVLASIMGGYDSPEAALHGVNPMDQRMVDMLTKTYQKRTGNAFADPFKDIANERDAAVMTQAMNGASLSVGNLAEGPSLLRRASVAPVASARQAPTTPFQPDLTSTVPALLQRPDDAPDAPASVATATNPLARFLPPTLTPWAARDVAGDQLRQVASRQHDAHQLADATLQLHNAVDPTTGQVDAQKLRKLVLQRSNLSGQANMLNRIVKNNPKVLSDPFYLTDSLFTHDAAGKVIPNEDYHPLLNDPTFRQEMDRDPEGATALYHAFSNRNLGTDIKAHSQALLDQQKNRQQMIEGLKTAKADPYTGEYVKTHMVKDPNGSGEYQLSEVPVTDFEKQLIDSGEWKRTYGMDLPGRGGIPKENMTDQEHATLVTTMQRIHKEHPDLPITKVKNAALTEIHTGVTPAKSSTVGPVFQAGLTKMVTEPENIALAETANPLIAMANFLKGTNVNLPIRTTNALLTLLGKDTARARMPLVPDIPYAGINVDEHTKAMRMAAFQKLLGNLGPAYHELTQ